jgi:hypothetical protein
MQASLRQRHHRRSLCHLCKQNHPLSASTSLHNGQGTVASRELLAALDECSKCICPIFDLCRPLLLCGDSSFRQLCSSAQAGLFRETDTKNAIVVCSFAGGGVGAVRQHDAALEVHPRAGRAMPRGGPARYIAAVSTSFLQVVTHFQRDHMFLNLHLRWHSSRI